MFSTRCQRDGLGFIEMNAIRVLGWAAWIFRVKALKSAKTCFADLPAARSLSPAYRTTIRGLYGRMMRSAKASESAISDPPKPRLMTLNSDKSCARVFHKRMLELPTNTTAPGGGGLVLSDASNALIAVSHLAESGRVWAVGCGAARLAHWV